MRELLGLARPAQPRVFERLQARPIAPGDDAFLRTLFADTRSAQMGATGWAASRCRAFLDQQFDFQQRQYRQRHADALFLLLLLDDAPVGRLAWCSGPARATLIDLSLAAGWRGRGLGSSVLRCLTESADQHGQTIGLQVEPGNPAYQLFRRFGFEQEPDHAVHLRMERRPAAVSTPA
ncbi:GNAT family N-acetyltransferase [Aquincola sp. S2]|uniref:GNAT family N-acetyltransferase n=1 Tax=Pseudaquabacterium terrae TaxID=2732868 RepID=A0ABX2EM13_9BURK|nr:GNAT family N-acetyltransferase [Aquabacterium terrae]NRF69646.1 GNAT family N-acetyltransferase [Aquabacterium terrae]